MVSPLTSEYALKKKSLPFPAALPGLLQNAACADNPANAKEKGGVGNKVVVMLTDGP